MRGDVPGVVRSFRGGVVACIGVQLWQIVWVLMASGRAWRVVAVC